MATHVNSNHVVVWIRRKHCLLQIGINIATKRPTLESSFENFWQIKYKAKNGARFIPFSGSHNTYGACHLVAATFVQNNRKSGKNPKFYSSGRITYLINTRLLTRGFYKKIFLKKLLIFSEPQFGAQWNIWVYLVESVPKTLWDTLVWLVFLRTILPHTFLGIYNTIFWYKFWHNIALLPRKGYF